MSESRFQIFVLIIRHHKIVLILAREIPFSDFYFCGFFAINNRFKKKRNKTINFQKKNNPATAIDTVFGLVRQIFVGP